MPTGLNVKNSTFRPERSSLFAGFSFVAI